MKALRRKTRSATASSVALRTTGFVILGMLLAAVPARATSGTWNGTTDANWSTATNWSPSTAPGSTSVTTNTDTATFNNAGNGRTTIAIDANRNLKTFNFDTSTASYTFGGGGLRLTASGVIALLSTATGTNLTETFNAPITFSGNATFTNARADVGSSLVFTGNITNTATSTLSLTGAGTGTGNLISGNITDGTGGTVQSVTLSSTGGTWTLSGTNTYSGLTNITGAGSTTVMAGSNSSLTGATTLNNATATLQLNSADNGGLAGGTLTLTAGTLQALNATRTLTNAVTLAGGGVTFSGDQSLTFTGKLTSSSFRSFNNYLAARKLLTLSDVDITSDAGAGRVLTILGTGDTTITGVIANGAGATTSGLTHDSTGTLTLKGDSTYTGTLSFNGGTTVLDGLGSTATLNSMITAKFGGGSFIFNGDNSGTGQTLGNVTVNPNAGSRLKVVAGSAGTTLALGVIAQNSEGGILNIILDNTQGSAVVTTTTTLTNELFLRAFVTLTIDGITEFATKTGANITQYTGQTAFVSTGSINTTNYNLTGSSVVTAGTTLAMSTLRIATNGEGQSLDISGKTVTLANAGLLFVGSQNYEIKDTSVGSVGSFNGGGSNSQLLVHHFGSGILTISANIVNASGSSSVLAIDGPGTTVLSGVNIYTGNTYFGGGALVSIGASSALGSSMTARTISLNNATLRATESFTLDNGSNARLIALATNGGTLDVSTGKTLTAPGVISGTGSLTKTGAGTLALTGVNTYTGSTTLNAGTLLVSGTGSLNTTSAITASGFSAKFRYDGTTALTRAITVTNNATFAYNSAANFTGTFTQTNGKLGGTNWNGNLSGLTIGANQTITPGNSVGSATTTTQTWASGGSYDFEINKADGTAGQTAGGWDVLNVTNALTITATSGAKFNLNVISLGLDNLAGNATGFVSTQNYAWLIADTGSAITSFAGSLFTIDTTAFTNSNTGTWALALGNSNGLGGTDQQLFLTYTYAAVPEPSTYAALLGAFSLLLAARRRSPRVA